MSVTWNPDDKGDQITLSNGDLSVSIDDYFWGNVRANTSKSLGKWYWEIHPIR